MPRGRRPGPSVTKRALVDAARRQFAAAGYDKTSVRAIAAEVGVDPGLVTHFFGSKDELFRAAVAWPLDPGAFLQRVVGPGRRGLAGRLARAFLEAWEDERTRDPLLAVLRSAVTEEASAAMVRRLLQDRLYRRLAETLGGPDPDLRIDLAIGQLLGIAVLRHVLRVEPVASETVEQLADRVTPVVQRALLPARR